MMNRKKIFCSLIVCLLTVFCLFSVVYVSADSPSLVADGDISETIHWQYYSDNNLIISGVGKIPGTTAYSILKERISEDICNNVKTLEIQDGITEIGSYAFDEFPALEKVAMADSVTVIGQNAFENCELLNSVTLPDKLESIAYEAFYGCKSLKEISLPGSLQKIGPHAFSDCSALETVNMPEELNCDLSKSVFYDCSSLKSITIPNGVKSIDEYAFYNCTALETVTILAETLTSVSENAFLNDLNIKTVELHSVGFLNENYKYEKLFQSAETLIVSEPVTELPENVFKSSAVSYTSNGIKVEDGIQLKTVILGDTVTKIGENAFFDCKYLEKIDMQSVTDIEDGAFFDCTSLKDMSISDEIMHIGSDVLDGTSVCVSHDGGKYLGNNLIKANTVDIVLNPLEENKNFYVFVIADGTKCIADDAFKSVSYDKTIYDESFLLGSLSDKTRIDVLIVPDSVVSFGASAYEDTFKSTGQIYYASEEAEWNNIYRMENRGGDYSKSAWDRYTVNFNSTKADFDAMTSVDNSVEYSIGDVDGNGTVSPVDARLALRAAVGLEMLEVVAFDAADIDNNKEIAPSEARTILRVAVGLESF